ncbi:MAG: hypothetical protein ACKORB_04825 [Opitutia bacterium]
MRPPLLAACLALAGAAYAQTPVSPEDLAALEALKAKTGAVQPALKPDELAELEAHRLRIAAAEAAAQPGPRRLRIVVADEEGDGYELALATDLDPPQLLLVPAAGRKAGDTIEAVGRIESVAKFQGVHRPVLTPVGTPVARRDKDGATKPASVTDALTSSGHDSAGGVQVSNVLFTFFAVVALAVVLLRIKSRIDAKKSGKRRR